MKYYDVNTSIVLDTLERFKYGARTIEASRNCYLRLHNYLEQTGSLSFSLDVALEWCNSSVGESLKQLYFTAIHRLSDVYSEGRILGSHLPIRGLPSSTFQSYVNSYITSLKEQQTLQNSSLNFIRKICMQFCCFIQFNDGCSSFDDMELSILDHFIPFFLETKTISKQGKGPIKGFLSYLAKEKVISDIYSLYFYYGCSGKIPNLLQLSEESRAIIELRREESSSFPADEFFATIDPFLSEMVKSKYAHSYIQGADYYLKVLYLFLYRESLGYDRIIAEAWISDVGKLLFSGQSHSARRILDMYEDFVNEGGIVIGHRRGMDNVYNHLPSWCKEEIDEFVNSRTIEGKSKATISNNKSAICGFCRFLVNEGLNSFSEITPKVIKSFNIQDKHKSTVGKNNCNCCIRLFLIHLELQNVIQDGMHYALPGCSTSSEKIVNILSIQDRERIKIYCEKASTPLELRDAAILQLGLSSALRRVDISTLLYTEIKWTDRLLHINQSKTKVNVTLRLDTATGNAIYKYIKEGRNNTTKSPYVFLSVRAPFGRMDRDACNQALKRAGLSISYTPKNMCIR